MCGGDKVAIRRKDNSFEGILDEIEFDKIPVEYISQLNLVLADGRILRIDGKELEGLDSTDDLLESPAMNEYVSELKDIEIIMNMDKVKEDVLSQIGPLLKKYFNESED